VAKTAEDYLRLFNDKGQNGEALAAVANNLTTEFGIMVRRRIQVQGERIADQAIVEILEAQDKKWRKFAGRATSPVLTVDPEGFRKLIQVKAPEMSQIWERVRKVH